MKREFVVECSEAAVLEAARRIGAMCKCTSDTRRMHEVSTAVAEALTNATLHGNGSDASQRVRVVAECRSSHLMVEVWDSGSGVRVVPATPDLDKKLRGDEPPSGWGVYLMCALATKVVFAMRDGQHVVSMTFGAEAPRRPSTPQVVGTPHG